MRKHTALSVILQATTLLLLFATLFAVGCDFLNPSPDPGKTDPVSVRATADKTSLAEGESAIVSAEVTGSDKTAVTLSASSDLVTVAGQTVTAVKNPDTDTDVTVTVSLDGTEAKTELVIRILHTENALPSIQPTLDRSTVAEDSPLTLSAKVTNLENTAVRWSADSELVSVGKDTLTVPKAPDADTVVTLICTSDADSTVSATVEVTVLAPKITLVSSKKSVTRNEESEMQVTVANTLQQGYTLSVDRTDLCSLQGNKLRGIAMVDSDDIVCVKVTLNEYPSVNASVFVVYSVPKPTISVTWSQSHVYSGWPVFMTAEVDNALNTGYTWTLSRNDICYMEGDVLYITGKVYADTDIIVTAIANADKTVKTAAKITVQPEKAYTDQQKTDMIASLKAKIGGFTYPVNWKVTTFDSPYHEPAYKPTVGQHPRVMVNADSLETVLDRYEDPANDMARLSYLAWSEKEIDESRFAEPMPFSSRDYTDVAIIEAKAFRYLLTGDELYGYQAIYYMLNYAKQVDVTVDGDDIVRRWGYVMYVSALVYDWCYDLMDESSRIALIAVNENYVSQGFTKEIGFPPTKQSAVSSHGSEAQLLRDMLSFSIAIYDEESTLYDFCAGRIFDEYVPGQNYYLQAGFSSQGTHYAQLRYHFLLSAQMLMDAMTGGKCRLFDDEGLAAYEYNYTYYTRPDGMSLRIGDDNLAGTAYDHDWDKYQVNLFYAGNYYKNAYLKGLAKANWPGCFDDPSQIYPKWHIFLSAPMFLLVNDPSVGYTTDESGKPLVSYLGSPLGQIIARSSHDEDACMVYMKVGESFVGGHEHKDAGSFQIYYKGILASDSGAYDTYGTAHDFAYNKQTIAHNCILVYNPNMTDTPSGNSTWIYSGGQSINGAHYVNEPSTLSEWKSRSTFTNAKVIGADYEADASDYRFSYLAGDITNAYDASTVDEVVRYMVSVMTDDPENPMVFVTFDRISADNKDYKKTILLHSQTEPTVMTANYTDFVIIENGGGRLVAQTLLTPMDITLVGGEGHQFDVNGENYPTISENFTENPNYEAGWGRVEFSPKLASKRDSVLTAMYVTDAGTNALPIVGESISSNTAVGVTLLGQAIVFPKEESSFCDNFSFESYSEDELLDYTVVGVRAGSWKVFVNGEQIGDTYTVTGSAGTLRFTAPVGDVRIEAGAGIRESEDEVVIGYNLFGGKLVDGAPLSYTGKGITLPMAEKKGYIFGGWYTSPDYRVAVRKTPNYYENSTYTVYAKWITAAVNEDYTQGIMGALIYQDIGSHCFNLATENEETFLRWNPAIQSGTNICYNVGLKSLLGDETCVSFEVTFGTDGTEKLMPLTIYLHDTLSNYKYLNILAARQSATSQATLFGLYQGANNAYLEQKQNQLAAAPYGEKTTITVRLTVDFYTETITAYNENREPIASQPIVVPDGYESALEWLEHFEKDSFVMGATTGTARLYSVTVAVGNIYE